VWHRRPVAVQSTHVLPPEPQAESAPPEWQLPFDGSQQPAQWAQVGPPPDPPALLPLLPLATSLSLFAASSIEPPTSSRPALVPPPEEPFDPAAPPAGLSVEVGWGAGFIPLLLVPLALPEPIPLPPPDVPLPGPEAPLAAASSPTVSSASSVATTPDAAPSPARAQAVPTPILHWAGGASWATVTIDTTESILSMWGSGSSNIGCRGHHGLTMELGTVHVLRSRPRAPACPPRLAAGLLSRTRRAVRLRCVPSMAALGLLQQGTLGTAIFSGKSVISGSTENPRVGGSTPGDRASSAGIAAR
jgi:hypothetical protein